MENRLRQHCAVELQSRKFWSWKQQAHEQAKACPPMCVYAIHTHNLSLLIIIINFYKENKRY